MKYAKQTPFRARACSPLTPSAPRPGIARGRLRACPARGYLDGSVRRDVPDAPGGRMGMSGIGAAARADGAREAQPAGPPRGGAEGRRAPPPAPAAQAA